MGDHIASNGGPCKVYPAPFAVNLFADDSTFVEPDLSVICDRSKLSDRGCEGAPDLVVEVVSPSNPGMDYVSKLKLYSEAGVREYWIIHPEKRIIQVYQFGEEEDVRLYSFEEDVPAGIYDDLTIRLAASV